MAISSLDQKTVRPGSLGTYSYYRSNRLPPTAAQPAAKTVRRPRLIARGKILTMAVLVAAVFGLSSLLNGGPDTKTDASPAAPTQAAPASAVTATVNHCAGNTAEHFIKISVTQRHLWACAQGKTVHDSPVITGMLAHESTLTPTGTYKIYAKVTNTTLTGKDETGSWSDPVYYWMPFLDNQHGTYGFHDATWRNDKQFGKVDANSSDASHGCIELPLAASKWLYNWAPIGTTVTVET